MIGDQIRSLREKTGLSQSELARKLSVTRSSVNAWESGLSAPTVYLIEMSRLFHVSVDYILGLKTEYHLNLSDFSEEEIHILYSLIEYFDKNKLDK